MTIDSDGTVRAGGAGSARSRSSPCPRPTALLADGDSLFSATAASGTIAPGDRHDPAPGRARGLQRRRRRCDGRHDGRAAQLLAGQQGDPDPGSDAPDRQPGEAMSVLGGAGLPPIDQSLLPADVRNGVAGRPEGLRDRRSPSSRCSSTSSRRRSTATAGADGSADGSSDGSSSDGVTDSSSGLLGSSDPASSTYAQLLPQALTSSIMSGGGIGIAQQLATALDPALGAPASAGAGAATAPALSERRLRPRPRLRARPRAPRAGVLPCDRARSHPLVDASLGDEVLAHLEAQLASARRLLQIVLEQGVAIRGRDVEPWFGSPGSLAGRARAPSTARARRAPRLLERAGARLGVAPAPSRWRCSRG